MYQKRLGNACATLPESRWWTTAAKRSHRVALLANHLPCSARSHTFSIDRIDGASRAQLQIKNNSPGSALVGEDSKRRGKKKVVLFFPQVVRRGGKSSCGGEKKNLGPSTVAFFFSLSLSCSTSTFSFETLLLHGEKKKSSLAFRSPYSVSLKGGKKIRHNTERQNQTQKKSCLSLSLSLFYATAPPLNVAKNASARSFSLLLLQ